MTEQERDAVYLRIESSLTQTLQGASSKLDSLGGSLDKLGKSMDELDAAVRGLMRVTPEQRRARLRIAR